MRCKDCHYPLGQLKEYRCPECGKTFDPNDADTFDPFKRSTVLSMRSLAGVLIAVFVAIWITLHFVWPGSDRSMVTIYSFWLTIVAGPVVLLIYLMGLAIWEVARPRE